MSAVLEQLHADLALDLDRVMRRFKPGMKVTLVVRNPENVEGDVVIGDDDLNEAIVAIQRRIGASPHGAKPPCEKTSPRWFTGHWRDKPRSMGAALEIAANGGGR